MAKTLYICYFGMREPLVQTQVLPYLRELQKADIEVSILTFESSRESSDLTEFAEIRTGLLDEDIEWDWLPYHKRPSAIATAWDILCGMWFVWRRIGRYDILHGRVHVPTLMGALARKLSRRQPKLLFDIRGFFPEEYIDAGIWPERGLLFRGAKRIERWLIDDSDGFVVLTEKACSILFPGADKSGLDSRGRPVEVIPCCVDLRRFRQADANSRQKARISMNLGERTVVAYVGSFGGWYLTLETIDFLFEAKKIDDAVFALILTQSDQEPIRRLLREKGFGESDFLVTRVNAPDVPKYLISADLAISFIKPCYSKQASSPTKNAEYLAMGLPIVANCGIGDTDRLINDEMVGVIVEDLDPNGYRSAFREVMKVRASSPEFPDRCRSVAKKYFDLPNVGGERYRRIYTRLLDQK